MSAKTIRHMVEHKSWVWWHGFSAPWFVSKRLPRREMTLFEVAKPPRRFGCFPCAVVSMAIRFFTFPVTLVRDLARFVIWETPARKMTSEYARARARGIAK